MVFGFIAVVALAQWLTGGQPMGSDLALLVAFYTVAAYEPLRPTVFCASVLELGIVLAAAQWSYGRSQLYLIVLLSGMGVAAGVLGLNVAPGGPTSTPYATEPNDWNATATSRPSSLPRPNGRGSPGRCTTSWLITWP